MSELLVKTKSPTHHGGEEGCGEEATQLCIQAAWMAAFLHVWRDGNRKQRKGAIPGFST